MDEFLGRIGYAVHYASDMYEALLDADALALITEWKQFRLPSWRLVSKAMRGNIIVDGRNIYDPLDMAEEGFTYYSIGRPAIIN